MVARKSPPVEATAAAATEITPEEPTKPRLRVRPRRYIVQLEAIADDGGDHVSDMTPVTFGIPAGELASWVTDKLPEELAKLEEQLNAGRADA